MLSLIQRVTRASVEVDGQVVGEIGDGLLALVGVEPGDGPDQLRRMVQKLLGYRVFADDAGKMNRSLADIGGGLLLVSQFTLAADTRSGMRPGFSTAAPPEEAERVFNQLLQALADELLDVGLLGWTFVGHVWRHRIWSGEVNLAL